MKIIITESQYNLIREMSISAYHGSPYDFDDFEINKMFSGHGDHWFGWGLYFSDKKDVADAYATAEDGGEMGYVYHVTLHGNKTPDQYDYMWYEHAITPKQADKIKKGLIRENITFKEYYIVHGESRRDIDWKYFHNLEDAKKYKDSLNYNDELFITKEKFNGNVDGSSGAAVYEELAGTLGGTKEASLFLLRCGIDGIITDDLEDRIYVVFDTNCIKIEKKEKL